MSATFLFALLTAAQQVSAADTLAVELGGQVVQLEVVEALRIGSLDGSPETTFGRVAAVVESDGREVVVADGISGSIRVFDNTGRYIREIGRRGEGPGEFTAIFGMALTATSDLAVWDFNSQRLSIFSLAGEFLRSFPTYATAMIAGAGPSLVVGEDGEYFIRIPGAPPTAGVSEAVYAWMKYSPEGEFIDSIFPPRRHVAGNLSAFKIETFSALSCRFSRACPRRSRQLASPDRVRFSRACPR